MYVNLIGRVYCNEETIHDYYETGANPLVDFTWSNTRTGKETTRAKVFTLTDALCLAERRREDGRYKNFEFYID